MENNILLMGRTPSIEKEYINNDIFLMTSNYEGLPNALIEAMASRLICISTDCKTGPKDLIESGENGFLIETNNIEQLVSAIRLVLDMNNESQNEIAGKARDKILEYCSQTNSAEKLYQLLEL